MGHFIWPSLPYTTSFLSKILAASRAEKTFHGIVAERILSIINGNLST